MAICASSHPGSGQMVGLRVRAGGVAALELECPGRRASAVSSTGKVVSKRCGQIEVRELARMKVCGCGTSSMLCKPSGRVVVCGTSSASSGVCAVGSFSRVRGEQEQWGLHSTGEVRSDAWLQPRAVVAAAVSAGASLMLSSPALGEATTASVYDAQGSEDVAVLESVLAQQVRLEMEQAVQGQAIGCRVAIIGDSSDNSGDLEFVTLPVGAAPSLLSTDMVTVRALDSVASSAIGTCVSSVAAPAIASFAGAEPAAAGLTQLLSRAFQHFSGGGIAGAVGAAFVHPLDTIKTRMQAQRSKEGEEPAYKDEFDCFKKLVAKEGPASLYDGLIPQLVGIAPEKAMKLTVNELLLGMLESMLPGARIWALEFIAGGGGGFSQVVFTNPMEMVKVRLQTQSKEGAPKNAWDVVRDLGVQGLYTGAGITMARDIPSSALFFSLYTFLRQTYPEHSFAAGFIAAIPATVLVTPFDIIKTRLQKEPAPGDEPMKDAWACLRQLWLDEGPKSLFKGSIVRVLRTSPQFGITLLIYNLLCQGS